MDIAKIIGILILVLLGSGALWFAFTNDSADDLFCRYYDPETVETEIEGEDTYYKIPYRDSYLKLDQERFNDLPCTP